MHGFKEAAAQAASMHAHRYVDSRAENGLTALHMAAALGDLACVKILLGAGASMMVRTVDLDMQSTLQYPAGSTPLHLAAQRGQIAILQAMLQVGHALHTSLNPNAAIITTSPLPRSAGSSLFSIDLRKAVLHT